MAFDSKFSNRTNWSLEENALSHEVRQARTAGRDLIDLTCSNPTVCEFNYGDVVLPPLTGQSALRYDPQPLGSNTARAAVAQYYEEFGAKIHTDRICMTTSTSEAYSFLFRLLCDPGDEVLVATPSYPLFEYLAQLDDIGLREYPLRYDPNADAESGWTIDLESLEAAIHPRCRALVLVHPNNPTGNFVSSEERRAVEALCKRHRLALIVDEVFLDYALQPAVAESFAVSTPDHLCFVLSGISKVCALPQMKVSWIVATGPDDWVGEAMARMEVIADTFLSMNLPTQLALPAWLEARGAIQMQILERMRMNLASLDARLRGTQARRLEMQGGWTVVVRVPRTVGGLPFAIAALERGALVQPGEIYGLPEGRIVMSLLTPPREWVAGLARLPVDG